MHFAHLLGITFLAVVAGKFRKFEVCSTLAHIESWVLGQDVTVIEGDAPAAGGEA